jgi:hypothetical protein
MNILGVGTKFYQNIVGTPDFMSWSNKNFVISFGVWTGGRVTMRDYGRLKTRRILE